MGFYGNIAVSKTQLSESAQIIENSFAFLDESATITVIKKEIDDLKKKDEITDKDIKALADKIKKMSDKEEQAKAITWIVALVIDYVFVFVGAATLKTLPMIISILTSCGIMVSMNKDYGPNGATIYAKIIKLEGKINNRIKKIQSLESEKDDTKAELKDLNKILEILSRLKPTFRNTLANRESAIEEAVLLEFKGNKDKTEAFKIICEEMAGLCEFNYKKIQVVKTSINEMISTIQKAIKASDKETGELVVKVRETGRKCQKDIDALAKEYGVNYPITLAVFRKDVKSFTVKYSEVTMEEKKRIANKLQDMDKKIYAIGKEYSTSNKEFHDKIINLYDNIDKAGKSGTLNTAHDTLLSWLDYIVSECNLTSNDIKGIMTDLNIKKTEGSFIYKVLNPVKKK